MSASDLRRRLDEIPFRPFALVTGAGKRFPVLGPEFCKLTGDRLHFTSQVLRLSSVVRLESLPVPVRLSPWRQTAWVCLPPGDLPTIPA